MPRLQPPSGFMTGKQAQERLEVSDTLLRRFVKEKKLGKYGPAGGKHQPFYKESEVEALWHSRQVFEPEEEIPAKRDWKNNPTATFGIANEKDLAAVIDIDRRTFDEPAASLEVCRKWYKKNPATFMVLKNDEGIVRGYASLVPMQKSLIKQFIHDQLSGENITADMIDEYLPGKPLHLYVMAIAVDPSVSTAEKRRYGQHMINGLFTFLFELANRGVEIESITARSHKKDGINLLLKMGFTWLRSPVEGHQLFYVNIPKSGLPFFLKYSSLLARWKEEHK